MSATVIRRMIRESGTMYASDVDLLAAVIGNYPLAKSVMEKMGTLGILANADSQDMEQIAGVSPAIAAQIRAACAIGDRMARAMGENSRAKISDPAHVADYLRENFRGKGQEELHVLLLDTRNFLIRDECITVGLVDRSQAHAREVFRSAIRENCSRVILCHNHPSGDPTPSPQDLECTRNITAAGKIIGIEVMDHVVIGKRTPDRPCDFLSFRKENLL